MFESLRTELKEALEDGGLDVEVYAPNSLPTPCAIIEPGSPYTEESESSFGGWLVRFDISLVVRNSSDNQKMNEDLDEMINTALAAVPRGWNVENVERPTSFEYPTGSERYEFGTAITVTKDRNDLV